MYPVKLGFTDIDHQFSNMTRPQLSNAVELLHQWIREEFLWGQQPQTPKGGTGGGDGGVDGGPNRQDVPITKCKLIASDVVVPIPHPETAPNLAGLRSVGKKLSELSPDPTTTLVDSIIDEEQGKIVLLVRRTGTHMG
jgi:hypothetical protein